MNNSILLGKDSTGKPVLLEPSKLNRHGLITGATGTGKTVTLKVLTEGLSELGIPVVLADVKGDLASLAVPGVPSEGVAKRLDGLVDMDNYFQRFPIRLWDVFGEDGHPLRVTVSDMGPLLLSRLLDLNDAQEGVLTIAFRVANENGWLILDLKDLSSIITYVGDHASELARDYGNIASSTIAALKRKLLTLEDSGATQFFGEPALDLEDLFKRDEQGLGMVNILASKQLITQPTTYAMFLYWLLSAMFDYLPEVGDLPVPKAVFVFDEAHILFDKSTHLIQEKLEQLIRMIRSKGVGVFFVTQTALDIPDSITGQLGHKIQHALRTYTPKEQKTLKAVAEGFRPNPLINPFEVIPQLKTGEALISLIQADGSPSPVEQVLIIPPRSTFNTLDDEKRKNIIDNSPYLYKYNQSIDRESAYEILQARFFQQQQELENQRILEQAAIEEEKKRIAEEKAKAKSKSSVNKMTDAFMGTIVRSIGREVSKNIFGGLRRR
ncbi:MAG: DUF853 family protein [Tissierellia bacterium]|nr:DUF853 family protein [Tissierellia bacterium]